MQEDITPPRNPLQCEALTPACSHWRPIAAAGSEATKTANSSSSSDVPVASVDSAAPAATRKLPAAP